MGFLAAAPFIGFAYLEYKIYTPVNRENINEEVHFQIESGKTAGQIAESLESLRLINNSFYFETYIWQKELGENLQAGYYILSPYMNIPKIVNILSGLDPQFREIKITIPEGFTLEQIQDKLVENNLIQPDELINLAYSLDNEIPKGHIAETVLLEKASSLEGFLFPDTYKFRKQTNANAILEKFLTNFDNKISIDLQTEITKQDMTVYEVLILASIVQKESFSYQDMRKVAGVFLNRLKIDKPLESDATVNYVTDKNLRQVTFADAKTESPYNTYLNSGLPPGPISNPGLLAIKAVIYPEKHNYLYFLHPRNSAMAVYSKTYQEHLRNQRRYLP